MKVHKDKIALVVPSLAGGGAERVMVNLAGAFCRLGEQVDLLVASLDKFSHLHVPSIVHVVDLKARRTAFAAFSLASYLRRERPKAVLVTLAHANIVALVARKLARVATRIVIRETSLLSISTSTSRQIRGRLVPFLAKKFYLKADAIIAQSQGVADDLSHFLALPSDRIDIIYNPVVSSELYERASRPPNHPWFAEEAPPVIVGVGRLDPEKDFSTLLRAFCLVKRNRNVRLMILGEGPERHLLNSVAERLGISEAVVLPGFVDNPLPFIANASVLVLTSLFEGLPNVLIEALACGTPVVATDCPGGTREILEQGRYGMLVQVGDVEALARAIEQTLDNPPDRIFLKSAAERFSVDVIAKQYLSVLIGGVGGQ
ncbi:MAG: glycosyltransferase [Desulfomonilaceae bacterium]